MFICSFSIRFRTLFKCRTVKCTDLHVTTFEAMKRNGYTHTKSKDQKQKRTKKEKRQLVCLCVSCSTRLWRWRRPTDRLLLKLCFRPLCQNMEIIFICFAWHAVAWHSVYGEPWYHMKRRAQFSFVCGRHLSSCGASHHRRTMINGAAFTSQATTTTTTTMATKKWTQISLCRTAKWQ